MLRRSSPWCRFRGTKGHKTRPKDENGVLIVRTKADVDMPRYTEFQMDGNKPIKFTKKRPAPLEFQDLSKVEFDESIRLSRTKAEMATIPCAPIDGDKFGLPDTLLDYLHKEKITHMTPVQAKTLQCMYASCDVAACAPTGSGKTFGICIGLVARLMREGPTVPFQTLFLAPSDELCWQIAHWIRSMWHYPNDPHVVFAATSDLSPADIDYRLEHRDYASATQSTATVRAPAIVVSTPEGMWNYHNRRVVEIDRASNPKLAESDGARRLTSAPTFPNMDTFVCDEVDSILPAGQHDAPGNQLLTRCLAAFAYQAPLNLILNSATLSNPTISWVKKFLRGGLLENTAVRLFDQEVSELRKEEAALGHVPRHIVCPETISHWFYSANTLDERMEVMKQVLNETTQLGGMTDEELTASIGGSVTTNEGLTRQAVKALVVLPDDADVEDFHLLLDEAASATTLDRAPRIVEWHETREAESSEGFGSVQLSDTTTKATTGTDPRTVPPLAVSTDRFSPGKQNQSAAVQRAIEEQGRDSFLICRANAIRGLNLPLTHIIIFAKPATMLEYVHWAGRVGRLGQSGQCVMVMKKHWIRDMGQFAETMGIPFKLQRRHQPLIPQSLYYDEPVVDEEEEEQQAHP